MNRPYLIYRNGILYRRRLTLEFAVKDMKKLRAEGFTASVAEERNVSEQTISTKGGLK